MSKDKAELCNKILKARKSAVSRGQNPKKAEERIRASYPLNKLSEYYEKAQSSKNGKNTAITPKQSKLICKDKSASLQAYALKITASKPAQNLIPPKQSKLICKNASLQACASKITASKLIKQKQAASKKRIALLRSRTLYEFASWPQKPALQARAYRGEQVQQTIEMATQTDYDAQPSNQAENKHYKNQLLKKI